VEALAEQFASDIPDGRYSPAAVQGHLMRFRQVIAAFFSRPVFSVVT
jgi:hypothetical protein